MMFLAAALIVASPPAELPDPLEAGWRGVKVCEVLQDTAAVRVLRCAFDPSVGHERHRHAPHVGYVLQGGPVWIKDADGEREVEPATGASWSSDGVTVHEIRNIGDTTQIYLIIEPKTAG